MGLIEPITGRAPDSIIIIESDSETSDPFITYINPSFTEMTGYAANEVIRKTTKVLQGPKSDGKLEAKLKAIFHDGKKSAGREISYRKDGSEFLMQWQIDPLRNIKGQLNQAIIILQDISDQQFARGQLARLARASALSEIAPDIIHEVNQPLTAIQSYTQACIKRLEVGQHDSAKLIELLGKIAKNTASTSEKIGLLRSVFNSIGRVRRAADINAIVNQSLTLASVFDCTKDVEFLPVLAAGLPNILVDAIQIQQVILNLIFNGIGAMEKIPEEQKSIEIVTSRYDKNQIQVSVSDRGAGIPDEIKQTLFTPFVSNNESGTGIGLSICQAIIHAHGGRIWFAKNKDVGTTFYCALPIGNEAPFNEN